MDPDLEYHIRSYRHREFVSARLLREIVLQDNRAKAKDEVTLRKKRLIVSALSNSKSYGIAY